MSAWSPPIYVQFPDHATALSMFEQLGGALNTNGTPESGNENYTVVGPIQEGNARPTYNEDGTVATAGDFFPGEWWMLRLNMDWVGYSDAVAAIAPVNKTEQIVGTDENPRTPWNIYA